MKKKKIELEFIMNASASFLFPLLSTASGLSGWFAEKVNSKKDIYTFEWKGSKEKAKMITSHPNQYVKFTWLDSEDKNEFFEMRIVIDELISEVSLNIIDFCKEEEVEETKLFWENQIENLHQLVGY